MSSSNSSRAVSDVYAYDRQVDSDGEERKEAPIEVNPSSPFGSSSLSIRIDSIPQKPREEEKEREPSQDKKGNETLAKISTQKDVDRCQRELDRINIDIRNLLIRRDVAIDEFKLDNEYFYKPKRVFRSTPMLVALFAFAVVVYTANSMVVFDDNSTVLERLYKGITGNLDQTAAISGQASFLGFRTELVFELILSLFAFGLASFHAVDDIRNNDPKKKSIINDKYRILKDDNDYKLLLEDRRDKEAELTQHQINLAKQTAADQFARLSAGKSESVHFAATTRSKSKKLSPKAKRTLKTNVGEGATFNSFVSASEEVPYASNVGIPGGELMQEGREALERIVLQQQASVLIADVSTESLSPIASLRLLQQKQDSDLGGLTGQQALSPDVSGRDAATQVVIAKQAIDHRINLHPPRQLARVETVTVQSPDAKSSTTAVVDTARRIDAMGKLDRGRTLSRKGEIASDIYGRDIAKFSESIYGSDIEEFIINFSKHVQEHPEDKAFLEEKSQFIGLGVALLKSLDPKGSEAEEIKKNFGIVYEKIALAISTALNDYRFDKEKMGFADLRWGLALLYAVHKANIADTKDLSIKDKLSALANVLVNNEKHRYRKDELDAIVVASGNAFVPDNDAKLQALINRMCQAEQMQLIKAQEDEKRARATVPPTDRIGVAPLFKQPPTPHGNQSQDEKAGVPVAVKKGKGESTRDDKESLLRVTGQEHPAPSSSLVTQSIFPSLASRSPERRSSGDNTESDTMKPFTIIKNSKG